MLLFYKPNFKSPLNRKAFIMHRYSPTEYEEKVKKWVKDYSGKANTKN
jgi:ubiquitin-protein ligase